MARVKFNPRKLMERAIEVMLRSVAEPRSDGKASPRVGALLYRPDGTTDTAYRGELRDGDHAEYTLLERKNRDRKLDGGVLFATLEPCAPGSRRHPKLACAERIVLARIKEVYVGIEDSDPTVDRKGIQYLQDNGVTVQLFDRDLQEQIQDANKEFIKQAVARARAAAEEKKPRPITLSPLENAFPKAATGDLSTEALDRYRTVTGIEEAPGTPEFYRLLAFQGLLKEENEQWVPTGFGLLLFGKRPRFAMRQAGLLGTIHYPDGREELKDFDGPQVLAPEQVLQWLRDKLPNPVDRTGARRREANALVHRDYGIEGAKCQLIVTPDTVTVMSPGAPLAPVTLERLQSFDAPMLSRNPVLHFVFSQMDLAEERGLGLKSMKRRAEKAELPLPAYSWKDPYLVLTFYPSPESAAHTLPSEVLKALNEDEQTGWTRITTLEAISKGTYAKATGYDERKAQRHLKRFVELGLLRRVGSGKATTYEVVR
jgi:ATP-dependent DNA helicase RecG